MKPIRTLVRTGGIVLLLLVLLLAFGFAVFLRAWGYGSMSPDGATEPDPVSWDAVFLALSFAIWPGLALWSSLRRRWAWMPWLAFAAYSGEAVLLGLSFGLIHVLFGIAPFLVAVIAITLTWRPGKPQAAP